MENANQLRQLKMELEARTAAALETEATAVKARKLAEQEQQEVSEREQVAWEAVRALMNEESQAIEMARQTSSILPASQYLLERAS